MPFDFSKLSGWASLIVSAITAVSIIIAGLWAFFKFIWQRERYPHIEFSADINVIGKQEGFWIVELISFIILHCKFKYTYKKDLKHSAEKTIMMPKN